jgi:hypothetical protein
MTNFLNKTQNFFKQKSVRIILALLVIAGIMTAISFGIIALIRAVSDPCASIPGTVWHDDLKKCVKRNCDGGNLCTSPNAKKDRQGVCVPKDYCKGKNAYGLNYKFDKDSCECNIDCGDDGEQSFAFNGNTYTKFTDGQPDDPLTCGMSCESNPEIAPGGKGWCPSNYLCGREIDVEHNDLSPWNFCFPRNGAYEQCKDADGNDKSICRKGECDTTGLCKIAYCSGPESKESGADNLVYPCINDNDCGVPHATCVRDGKFGFYKQYGYCSQNNKRRDRMCTTKKMLGESKSSDGNYNPINCEEYKTNPKYKNTVGLSGGNNPCPNFMVPETGHGCAKDGICSNNWQASDPEGNISCRTGKPTGESDITLCCADSHIADDQTDPTNQFCCGIPYTTVTYNGGKNKLKYCALNTNNGYSKKILLNDSTLEMNDHIYCTSDPECEKYNNDLWKNLGKTGTNPLDYTKPEFSKMYCDTNAGVCKAVCGKFDPDPSDDNFGKIDNNKVNNSFGYCFPKDTNCKLALPIDWRSPQNSYPEINNIPICESDKSGFPPRWTSSEKEAGYTVNGSVALEPEKGKTCLNNTQECANVLGKNFEGIDSISVNGNNCDFTVGCDNLLLHSGGDKILWSEILDPNNKNKVKNFLKTKTDYIVQSPNVPKNPSTELSYYYSKEKGVCKGDSGSLSEEVTTSPVKYVKDTDACSSTGVGPFKLTNDGLYCDNYVDITTNQCKPAPP